MHTFKSRSTNFQVTNKKELHRLVYYGGVSHDIRKEVWPYLLHHYEFGSKPEERQALDEEQRQQYEKVILQLNAQNSRIIPFYNPYKLSKAVSILT